jgi:hypothetical protein
MHWSGKRHCQTNATWVEKAFLRYAEAARKAGEFYNL